MRVKVIQNGTTDQITRLELVCQTFSDEQIATALLYAIKNGLTVVIEHPDREEVLSFGNTTEVSREDYEGDQDDRGTDGV